MRNGVWQTQRAQDEMGTFIYGFGPEPVCGHVCIDDADTFGRPLKLNKTRELQLIVSESDSILDIKAYIAVRAGVPPDRQILTTLYDDGTCK